MTSLSKRLKIHRDSGKEAYYSQWTLSLLRFRKHKLAVVSFYLLIITYIFALFAGFFAPYDANDSQTGIKFAPPVTVHFWDENGPSRPFIYGYEKTYDPDTFKDTVIVDMSVRYYLDFFVRGSEYKILGIFKSDMHLFGVEEGRVHLLGTDRASRDMLSRILYGAQISTTVGLIGVLLSFVIGIIIGGVSGYFGGVLDTAIQRIIELIMCIPTIPLWMSFAAIIPATWESWRVYLMITIILSFVGWTGLARVVRSKFISLKQEEFVKMARVAGAGTGRIIFIHMLPSFFSHLIASLTLAIPGMILGECALSFLGLGIRAPSVSWGTMLQDVQDVRMIAYYPWLLLPALFVFVTVISFNFLGDGMRDAVDPYTR